MKIVTRPQPQEQNQDHEIKKEEGKTKGASV